MNCPLIYGSGIKHCSAVQGLVILSVGELKAFCENWDHKDCFVFKEREKSGRQIPFSRYYNIFLRGSGFQQFYKV